ncbi:MAG TPA: sugar ABC transporter ATP-binding protein [Bauldia sp.]|nr:sugar ABC transporter ATP-binding protein [Bauldia sp.]
MTGIAAPETPAPLLRLTGIRKAFSGVPALRDVRFDLLPGEVHAIAGENGAGKSTLIKIVSGAYTPDAGTIEIGGRSHAALTPRQARAEGVAVVYQEFNLLPYLTVAENMFLGDLPGGRIAGYSARRAEERASGLLRRLGSDLDPSRLVGELTVAEQQLVEIGAALALDAQIIIMDEPSTVLDSDELALLHGVIRRLREERRGVVYISHRLDEVLGLADRVTVFKDGEYVLTAPTASMTHDTLIRAMIGRDLVDFFPNRVPAPAAAPLLEVGGVTVPGKIFDVSLVARAGEIVGIAGLGGSGKTTLCRALVGLEPGMTGRVAIEGRPAPRNPGAAARAGLVMVPEDRKAHGIFAGHAVAFNLTISALSRLKRLLLVSRQKERALVDRAIAEFDVRPRNPGLDIAKLSGGNQQKVVLGRWLSGAPRIVVLDEPTRGVDVGAKAEIYALIEKFAEAGAAILIASSDVTELLGMCDRILVFHQGRIVDDIERARATEEAVIRAATIAARAEPAEARPW